MIKAGAKYSIRQAFRLLPVQIRRYIHSISMDLPINEAETSFENLTDQSISKSHLGDFDGAERSLRQAAMLDPSNPRIAPHLGRVRFLQARAADAVAESQTQSMLVAIKSMPRKIESSNPIYVPSKYWNTMGAFHISLLERYGIENFKRTVSHDYQNWHMTDRDDPQVRQLFKTWPIHFPSEPWFNTMEVPDHVGFHLSLNFENPINPLASVEQREIYRVSVGLLWIGIYVAARILQNVVA